MFKPIEGTLTSKTLLDKAQQIHLGEEVKLVRVTGSERGGSQAGWIVIENEYFLTRRGWRKYSDKPNSFDPEEFRYNRALVPFETAVEAADFYYSHCLGQGTKPTFDLKIEKLRDHLLQEFSAEDADEIVKAAVARRWK